MILQTKELFALQDILQQRILKEHNLTQAETMQRRYLALLVELGELANETRCFKYWSRKGPSEKAIVLEEYVDGIHFLLCLGLDLQTTPETVCAKGTQKDLSTLFMDVYGAICELRSHPSASLYHEVFSLYVWLGECLGFTNEDICNSYFMKNKENHHRQDVNY